MHNTSVTRSHGSIRSLASRRKIGRWRLPTSKRPQNTIASIFQRRHGTNWVFTRNVNAKRLLPRRRRRASDIRRRGSQELELSASLTTNLSESAPGITEGKDRIVVAPDGASPRTEQWWQI